MSDGPVFIVGCGRSGTSLLRRFMNQHRQVGIPLESLFIVDYLHAAARLPVERMTGMLIREPEILEWGLHPATHDLAGCATIAEAIDRLHQLYLAPRGKSRWGQKTPRFVRHLPLLRFHFPEARFVNLVRDPRAVAASLIRSNVHRSTAYYAARRWRMDVDFGLAFEQAAPGCVLRVAYEELVARPESVLRGVCEFCGLDFDPKMLASAEDHASEYSDFYAQIHANVDHPATRESVDRWANDLSEQQVELIEHLAGDANAGAGLRASGPRPAGPAFSVADPRRSHAGDGRANLSLRPLPSSLPRLLALSQGPLGASEELPVVRQLLSWAWLPLQVAFLLLLTAFIGRAAYLRWDEVRAIQMQIVPAWLMAGVILTVVFTFGLSLSWQWLVRRLSPAASDLSSLGLHRAFLTSFLTRYLPAGSLVNIGGKVELLRRQGASCSVGIESVLYEIVFLMGGGLFLGWVAFLVEPAPQFLDRWQALYPIMMVAMVVVWALCFAVPDRVLMWGRSLLKRELPGLSSTRLTWVDRLVAFVLYTSVNLIQGVAVLCMLVAVYPGLPRDVGGILHVLAAYPIGRLVGQAAPFAPGGIGVREATFVFLAAPWVPLEPLLIAATLMRLISILIEIAAVTIIVGLGRLPANRMTAIE